MKQILQDIKVVFEEPAIIYCDNRSAISLSKNVVRSIEAQSDLPPFELYPKAHRVTYRYYTGVLAFLQEDYTKVGACTGKWTMSLMCNRRKPICRKLGTTATLVLRRTKRMCYTVAH